MSTSTIIALGIYFVVAFAPKVPWYVKVVLQLIVGAVIYFAFADTMFDLPAGDTSPISSVFGGAPDGMDGFNKYAMGVLGTVLGLLGTLVATILYAVIGKKSED